MSDENDKKTPSKPIVVKTEGGSLKATSPLVRLPSFRQPRDLTLGAGSPSRGGALSIAGNKARRNYAPNLNVQRNKIKEEVKVKEESTKQKTVNRGRGRGGSDRGRGDRGRGRGANVIQLSSGVFAEGIAASQKQGRYRGDGPASSFVPKPKLNLKQNFPTDSKEEGERLKQLLQDDFVDDPDAATDDIKPLQLPMIPIKKGALTPVGGRVLVKKEKEDPDLSIDSSLCDKQSVLKSTVKKEPVETEELDFKSELRDEEWTLFDRHVRDLLVSREPEYILIQLPDCLPGLRPTIDAENTKSSSSSNVPSESTCENTPQPQCTLASLPEGLMGKIQLLRSGRARLQLGAVSLPVSMGTQVAFRQDLISVNLNDLHKSGSMINLGQVRTRVVVTPDWETLLRKV